MKTRKTLTIFVISALLLFVLSLPAFALDVNMGAPFDGEEPNQVFWCTNGLDDLETPVEMSDFAGAKYLLMEFSAVPADDLTLNWASANNNWNMGGEGKVAIDNFALAEGSTDTKLIINLADTLPGYQNYLSSTEVFIIMEAAGINDLTITAKLIDELPPSDTPNTAQVNNPQTGDNNLIYVAAVALIVSLCAVFALKNSQKGRSGV